MFSRRLVKIAYSTRTILHHKCVTNSCTACICKFPGTRSMASTTTLQKEKTLPNDTPKMTKVQIVADNKLRDLKTLRIPEQGDKKKPVTPLANAEEVLEKFTGALSSDIHTRNRVYKNQVMRVLDKVKEMNFMTRKQGLLLLRCCTQLLPDESPASRMTLAEEVWNTITLHTNLDTEHYNELLRVYIANKRTVIASAFFQKMSPVKPNITTYELIIKAIGEAGDLNQATEVISNMKTQNLPATEDIFNSLIVCEGKSGHPKNIKEVLTMMQSLKIEQSSDTHMAVARAYAFCKDGPKIMEYMGQVYNRGTEFEERHVMEVVKTLAEVLMYEYIPKVLKFLPEKTLNSPSISPYMQVVTTELVFRNHPMIALEIYKCLPTPSFGPKDDQGLHGRSLVRDCVKASMPSSVIGLITQELMASGRNPIALQNASEAALQQGKIPLALDLFTRMKQIGMPLRSHFFWPILLQSSKSYGEKGIMNTINKMVALEVTPDYETFMNYILPYVSFTSPQNLMKKFLETGLTTNTILTPMMETLINTGQVRAASEICELFHGKINGERLVKALVRGYHLSMDKKSTMFILEDIYKKPIDKTKDWVGRFLCYFLKHNKNLTNKHDINEFMGFVTELKDKKILISTSAADFCLSHIPSEQNAKLDELKELLINLTDEKLADEGEIFTHQMPHPKQMNEESLKAHLIELESKGMNTRGALRKLLQEYVKSGNLPEARKIITKCNKEGVFLSAGMKASIFDLHVKLGELDLAEATLADLSKASPNFTLDEYKVIDFATLMVYKQRIDKAFDLINEQSKKRHIKGGRSISMNCWRLLDAVAANNSHVETRNMFDLITSLRYCFPSNSILGPLIRVHLKHNNLIEAVNEFVRIAKKYNKTPLKHELLCLTLRQMSDGISEENFLTNERCNGKLNQMAQSILQMDKKVHGAGDVQLTLIAALAEVGYKKTLRRMLLDPAIKIHPDALMRRCERFADEKKIAALETIAECAKDLRHIDVSDVYDLILDVYQRDDEIEKAMELWTKMQELNLIPSQKFARTLCALAKANNKPAPSDLLVLGKQEATST